MSKNLFLSFLTSVLFTQIVLGQNTDLSFWKPSDTLNIKRKRAVYITESSISVATLFALDQLWYKDYPRSKFRTINDSEDWLQMDKAGHVFSSYHLGRLSANAFNWSGAEKKDQLLYGATFGLAFLSAIEIMDGFSEEWGFSLSDMAANSLGTGLYVGQELLWKEQRVLLKYSFHQTRFASQRPDRLGDGLIEEFLKDYNGQTYWLSVNVNSFFSEQIVPKWLNIAFGYGADGMLTGSANDITFSNQNRMRQFYLSLDVDLARIDTNSHLLKTIFNVLNVIKIPFPTIEVNSKGALKLHYVYY